MWGDVGSCARPDVFGQKSTDLLANPTRFRRQVREIGLKFSPRDFEPRWQKSAFDALQEAGENFVVQWFEDVQKAAIHAKRITVMDKDASFINGIWARFTNLHLKPVVVRIDGSPP